MKIPKIVRELGLETGAEWINDAVRGRGKVVAEASVEKLRRELDPTEDHRADLLDDMSRMDEPRRRALLRRIQQAEHGAIPEQYGDISKLKENDFVNLLAKIRTDDDGSRTAKLEWLVDLPEEEFWAYMDLLWHNPLQAKFDDVTRIAIDVANTVAQTLGVGAATAAKAVLSTDDGAGKLADKLAKERLERTDAKDRLRIRKGGRP